MNKGLKKILIVGSIVILFITSAGFIVEKEFKIAKNLDIFFSLFRELNLFYVDETNPEKMIKDAIDSMLDELDPYTNFIPESDADDFKFQTTGQYGGIGALIRKNGKTCIISEPYEGLPANKAGIKAGDEIITIDGISVDENEISKVSERLKGVPGTKVSLEIKRFGINDLLKIVIVRQQITIPNVPYYGMLTDSIGYIKLNNFTTDAGKEVKQAVIELKKKNANSIIFDLRGNPGGLLNEAVNVTNVFVGKNQEIVSTKGKIKKFDNLYKTSSAAVDTSVRLIVLVDRGSASASEIVAGSLQDLDRAVLIGQRTFGKGLVQTTRPLSYNTQLKVTTAKYYIPSGRCIQALDYTHRNDDGSVGKVPDSLITEFKTKKGRSVYDGGGINPDIVTDIETLSNVAYALLNKNIIFDFATTFVSSHDSINIIDKFKIEDDIYSNFIKYVENRNFDYKTNTEEQLNKLIETAKKEKYFSLSEIEFEQLKTKLSHDKNKDLETFKKEISELLRDEIISRYYFQKGRIAGSLTSDPEILKGIEILKARKQYSDILNGKDGELTKMNGKYKKNNSIE